jgi:hypothetical protein
VGHNCFEPEKARGCPQLRGKMKILRIIFACGILALVTSCVSSTTPVQSASPSPTPPVGATCSEPPETSQRSRPHLTGFDDYDEALLNQIKSNWFNILDRRSFGSRRTGKVVLKFILHSDGQITDMNVARNDVGDLLADLCEEAVMKGVPYSLWTDKMLKTLKTNSLSIDFTFVYQ